MIYFVVRDTGISQDAGTKAPKDINDICSHNHWEKIKFIDPAFKKYNIKSAVKSIKINNNNWKQVSKLLNANDIVLFQHPMYFGSRFANKYIPLLQDKGIIFVALIHDLESLRNINANNNHDTKSNEFSDLVLLRKFNYIIAHNNSMEQYLVNNGFKENKIVNLEIFDYLSNTPIATHTFQRKITIAGNLDSKKCSYIYQLAKTNSSICIELFGNNFDNKGLLPNIMYMGSVPADEICSKLTGAFGIVWDGPSILSCEGNTGNYLRFNNPHKASLYLASGMPIITWSKSAIADFITSNRVGVTVDNLTDLGKVFDSISLNRYNEMAKNAREIAIKLREGFYFNQAMHAILEKVKVKD